MKGPNAAGHVDDAIDFISLIRAFVKIIKGLDKEGRGEVDSMEVLE